MSTFTSVTKTSVPKARSIQSIAARGSQQISRNDASAVAGHPSIEGFLSVVRFHSGTLRGAVVGTDRLGELGT